LATLHAILQIEFFAQHHWKEELKTFNLSGSTSLNSQKQPSYRVYKFQITTSTDLKMCCFKLDFPNKPKTVKVTKKMQETKNALNQLLNPAPYIYRTVFASSIQGVPENFGD